MTTANVRNAEKIFSKQLSDQHKSIYSSLCKSQWEQ